MFHSRVARSRDKRVLKLRSYRWLQLGVCWACWLVLFKQSAGREGRTRQMLAPPHASCRHNIKFVRSRFSCANYKRLTQCVPPQVEFLWILQSAGSLWLILLLEKSVAMHNNRELYFDMVCFDSRESRQFCFQKWYFSQLFFSLPLSISFSLIGKLWFVSPSSWVCESEWDRDRER